MHQLNNTEKQMLTLRQTLATLWHASHSLPIALQWKVADIANLASVPEHIRFLKSANAGLSPLANNPAKRVCELVENREYEVEATEILFAVDNADLVERLGLDYTNRVLASDFKTMDEFRENIKSVQSNILLDDPNAQMFQKFQIASYTFYGLIAELPNFQKLQRKLAAMNITAELSYNQSSEGNPILMISVQTRDYVPIMKAVERGKAGPELQK
ncbi:hypothetical protein N9Z27_00870 [Alphaproteobacteria bacterium]|nr:hypothetical protein [Alphaproteobacteria bacterium]